MAIVKILDMIENYRGVIKLLLFAAFTGNRDKTRGLFYKHAIHEHSRIQSFEKVQSEHD